MRPAIETATPILFGVDHCDEPHIWIVWDGLGTSHDDIEFHQETSPLVTESSTGCRQTQEVVDRLNINELPADGDGAIEGIRDVNSILDLGLFGSIALGVVFSTGPAPTA